MSDGIERAQRDVEDLVEAVRLCIRSRLILPAFTLLYVGIDVAGWLAAEGPDEPVKKRFTQWVDRYLLPHKALKARAIDIYGARCGLLHTFTANSDLSAKGEARRLINVWGTAKAEDYDQMADAVGVADTHVAVHVEDLLEGFQAGVAAFFKELEADSGWRVKVNERATLFFQRISPRQATDFAARYGRRDQERGG